MRVRLLAYGCLAPREVGPAKYLRTWNRSRSERRTCCCCCCFSSFSLASPACMAAWLSARWARPSISELGTDPRTRDGPKGSLLTAASRSLSSGDPPGGPLAATRQRKKQHVQTRPHIRGTEPHGSKKAEWDGCRHALRPCCRNLCTRQEALNQLQLTESKGRGRSGGRRGGQPWCGLALDR